MRTEKTEKKRREGGEWKERKRKRFRVSARRRDRRKEEVEERK